MATFRYGRLQFISLLLATSFSAGTVAGNTYQWTDIHGQIHFGDNPPARAESTQIHLSHPQASGATGLRPAEVSTLLELEQRADRQQQRARAIRRHSDQQLATGRAACRAHREQLHQSQGKDGFKQHARYLRTHCW